MKRARQYNIYLFLYFFILFFVSQVLSQDNDGKSEYILGDEEKLEMKVHVWGEVLKPGEYQVSYDTNVLELISKSGGPSTYADLSKISVTREGKVLSLNQDELKHLVTESRSGKINEKNLEKSLATHFSNKVVEYNLTDYLESNGYNPPPGLHPGDVVYVPKNKRFTWKEVVTIARDMALIASVYVYYLRAK